MADRLERLCKDFMKEIQMKHLGQLFNSFEYQSIFNMSDDIQMSCLTDVASSDFDLILANFLELYDVEQQDQDDHIRGHSAPDIDRDTDGDIDQEPLIIPPDIQSPSSPEDPDQSLQTRRRRSYDGRVRRKPLETKTLLSQCLLQWLDDPQYNPEAIKWISKKDGLFQITNSAKISSLWGNKKENKKMNHEKLSRALRHYYKDGTLEKLPNKKRLCYKFSESAMRKFDIYFTKQ